MLVPPRMPNDCPEQSVLGGTLVRRGLGDGRCKALRPSRRLTPWWRSSVRVWVMSSSSAFSKCMGHRFFGGAEHRGGDGNT